jgi:hypothetical protein
LPGHTAALRLTSVSNVAIRSIQVNASSHVVGDQAISIVNRSNILIDNIDGTNLGGYGVFTHADTLTEKVTIRDSRLYGKGNADILGGGTDNSTGAVVRGITLKGNYLYRHARLSCLPREQLCIGGCDSSESYYWRH